MIGQNILQYTYFIVLKYVPSRYLINILEKHMIIKGVIIGNMFAFLKSPNNHKF